jgi:serine/threonine-protein kinase
MTLASGTRIGSYELGAILGVGGMGEVYRARDTKLNRDVALKVLPEAFASDQDRLARLRREAQVLASLNHPHVAAIYGLEEAAGKLALVLELVEGEALDERLKRGPISIEEALPMARQMAEGLEAAHEKGIVHRDLKPGNVKLTKDGEVKILDFGLAKALEGEVTNEGELSQSPTLSRRMTEAGVILGTAGYMSPEQARGKALDQRADIWAFGVVLFEMLSGGRLFSGETVSDTLAAVLRQEINWKLLPLSTPPAVRRLLERCLHRDPKQRLRDIGEARIAIEAREEVTPLPIVTPTPFWRRALPWALAGLGFAVAFALWAPWRPAPEPATPVRLSVELGAEASLAVPAFGPTAILSPDGKLLAFTARKTGGDPPQLYVRRLEELRASPLAGTEGADEPFFSPDSQWIGFFADDKLKKIAVAGAAAVTLCDVQRGIWSATWSEDGTIFFDSLGGLSRVSSSGGTPEVVTTPDPTISDRWPQALPGGGAVLFSSGLDRRFEDASIVVQSLPDGPRKVLHQGGYHARYLPSGHIVYMHDGTLFGAPFDLGRLELTGPPAPILEGVTANPLTGGAQFAFSQRGTLVFRSGRNLNLSAVTIHWVDQDGKTEPLRALAGYYYNIRFSPDGRRIALDTFGGREQDVWVYEWERNTMSRLTIDPSDDGYPVWTPDGERIAFSSTRADKDNSNLYWQRADGTGDAERLTDSENSQQASSWDPSGKLLAFGEFNPETGWDIMILPMEGDEASGWKPGKPRVFLNGPFFESAPMFSPDGRWLAYYSDESGRREVYVQSFPGPGSKWPISAGGGTYPIWSRSRRELLYHAYDERIMVVPYTVEGDAFRAEKPRPWSPALVRPRGPWRSFDLHRDEKRVAVLKGEEGSAEVKPDHVVFIENFFEELRRLAPAGER